jgi:hypothetical protein
MLAGTGHLGANAMEGRAHRVQCLFTEVASARAQALGMELHFSFPADESLPQVGDFVGIARGGPRSRFVVREREFLWDADTGSDAPSAVLLMLDLPEPQWGESAAGSFGVARNERSSETSTDAA